MKRTLIFSLLAVCLAARADAARIKDLAYLEGARSPQVVGYGLVVGLSGTGDKLDPSTQKAVSNMLSRFGITVGARELRSRNVASVLVTAELPAFPQKGQKVDAAVSSIGDATSLEGGTLLRMPLYAPDGAVGAMAQGAVAGGKRRSAGRVSGGAEVEMSRDTVFEKDGVSVLMLNRPDFQTAREIERAVTGKFGPGSAQARDASAVRLNLPQEMKADMVGFMAKVGLLEINPDLPAKVVVNSVTGTVVIGGQTRLLACAVSAGEIQVEVGAPAEAGTDPAAGAQALEQVNGETLETMVKSLNALGATPKQLVEVIRTLHSAGVFSGELEII